MKNILIVSIENKLILRLKEKLLEIIRRFVAKFKLIMHVLYKGIKFLWREYHFLVPPSMWKKYFKDRWKKYLHLAGNYANINSL